MAHEHDLLARSPLFSGGGQPLLDAAMALCTRQSYHRGDTIYTPKDFHRSLGLLVSGRVLVSKGTLQVSVLEPGRLFGAAALFTQSERYATTLTALSPCKVLFLSQRSVSQLLEKFPDLAQRYIRYLSDRIQFLSTRLDAIGASTVEERLRTYLLANADSHDTLSIPAAALARTLGVGRASLYRAFCALEEEGFLTRTGKFMIVRR